MARQIAESQEGRASRRLRKKIEMHLKRMLSSTVYVYEAQTAPTAEVDASSRAVRTFQIGSSLQLPC